MEPNLFLARMARRMPRYHRLIFGLVTIFCASTAMVATAAPDATGWPALTSTSKPRCYWWWMGSAVDTNNIAKELQRYHDAGLGGVHIIPIYGAKGWESNYITFLSPKWMEMLDFTVSEAKRLGMEVDMTTGTGWCFGGPRVTDEEANALMVNKQWNLSKGEKLSQSFDATKTQALMAFGPDGKKMDLLEDLQADGSLNWNAPSDDWKVYSISQKPSGQKVKRAAPGGEGHMLNLFYAPGMSNYLRWMDDAFKNYHGAKPRAQYHDSYEYKSDWSPDFFAQFEKRRGYRLQDHLDVFFSGKPADQAARLKCDYRETISDIMADVTLPMWTAWAHKRGFINRNEAHGSPGNWLDLYAAADIPETEMFSKQRNILVSKFASSAAHVTGKPLVSSETGTWLNEHFTETLADMKYLVDDMFLAGINHIFYHGTCYSPDEAAWPGWVFYASYEMNPRNSVWHDVSALNAYVARCQSVLQSGRPDNDVLLYWPIHDYWSNPAGMVKPMTVDAHEWFEQQPIGKTAAALWKAGYQFDCVSDKQLTGAKSPSHGITLKGGSYSTIVIPPCEHMPLETLAKLVDLSKHGSASIIFADNLPNDVPGFGNLDARRRKFAALLKQMQLADETNGLRHAGLGNKIGGIYVGPLTEALDKTLTRREPMFDVPGLMCIRRVTSSGTVYYFVANRGEKTVDDWVPLGIPAPGKINQMDPLSGKSGLAASRQVPPAITEVRLSLPPGGSTILALSPNRHSTSGSHDQLFQTRLVPAGDGLELKGSWQVKFLTGGPVLPEPFVSAHPESWTESPDTNAQSFAGTALYTLKFNAPQMMQHKNAAAYQIDLGKVCQSAKVRLNGEDLGTLLIPPFRVMVKSLKPTGNMLQVEVTGTSANRIRDLDRRGVLWKNFNDINFVNISYKKFDASNWRVADCGLLGPVTLTPLQNAGAE